MEEEVKEESQLELETEEQETSETETTETNQDTNNPTEKEHVEGEGQVKEESKTNALKEKKNKKNTNGKDKNKNKSNNEEKIELNGRTFTPKELTTHLSKLLHEAPLNEPLEEIDVQLILHILEKYHPTGVEKIKDGVKTVVPKTHSQFQSRCFVLIRNDGTEEDFSLKKCLATLFPRRVLKFTGFEPGVSALVVKV